jgi:hypothetical protein
MQARRRTEGPERRARRTVRIVCEGDAEVCVVRHLRAIYLGGNGGHAVSHKNARGKGGRRVLELALSPRVRAEVDVIGILIDTDQDWDDGLRLQVQRRGVPVVESVPCLEAWLLQAADKSPPTTTAECKREFRRVFGAEAHEESVYTRHLDRSRLDAARSKVAALNPLLTLFGA